MAKRRDHNIIMSAATEATTVSKKFEAHGEALTKISENHVKVLLRADFYRIFSHKEKLSQK